MSKRIVNGLRILWVSIIFWFEYAIFRYSAANCPWPLDAGGPKHVLLVADPQILHRGSYPNRPALLAYLTQLIVDLNLRKSWRAALTSAPDACFFLGDMMDGGREVMSDIEYERYFRRFKSIFSTDSKIPIYFIPGNHDVGLGSSSQFSPQARARYESHFGPPNSQVSISNYTFVLVDAPGLVEEDYQRHGQGKSYANWKPVSGGTIDFVKTFASRGIHFQRLSLVHSLIFETGDTEPVILLSHIPLSRPEGSNCGPLRERGTIRRGVGLGYQNTLGKDSSAFLLEQLRPTLIFTGDDHDYCEYTHALTERGSSTRTREVTIKSLSIAMGITRPGYHMLSIVPPGGPQFTHSDAPCLMPNQLGIYLHIYIPLAVISLAVVLISCIIHGQYYRRLGLRRPSLSPHSERNSRQSMGSVSHIHRNGSIRSRNVIDEYGYTLDGDKDEKLPLPASASVPHPQSLFNQKLRCSLGSFLSVFKKRNRGGFLSHVWCDVRDVAVFPLGIIFLISFWTLMDF
ncbi:hypothetical protein GYMLUDRAFT_238583 [Collybiopsis luxurians FD-317 M1]|nr:hypothetical protein GYMLUDRAFT_238583 [Collybiopsis luxurians FD-317 M1]